jgi:hypothetical protein
VGEKTSSTVKWALQTFWSATPSSSWNQAVECTFYSVPVETKTSASHKPPASGSHCEMGLAHYNQCLITMFVVRHQARPKPTQNALPLWGYPSYML